MNTGRVTCCAYGCSRTTHLLEENSLPIELNPFFGFPIDTNLRRKWIEAINRDKFSPSSKARICSLHFKPSDFTTSFGVAALKPDAVPSIFNFSPDLSTRNKRLAQKQIGSDTNGRLERPVMMANPKSNLVAVTLSSSPGQVLFNSGTVKLQEAKNTIQAVPIQLNIVPIQLTNNTLTTVPLQIQSNVKKFKTIPVNLNNLKSLDSLHLTKSPVKPQLVVKPTQMTQVPLILLTPQSNSTNNGSQSLFCTDCKDTPANQTSTLTLAQNSQQKQENVATKVAITDPTSKILIGDPAIDNMDTEPFKVENHIPEELKVKEKVAKTRTKKESGGSFPKKFGRYKLQEVDGPVNRDWVKALYRAAQQTVKMQRTRCKYWRSRCYRMEKRVKALEQDLKKLHDSF